MLMIVMIINQGRRMEMEECVEQTEKQQRSSREERLRAELFFTMAGREDQSTTEAIKCQCMGDFRV